MGTSDETTLPEKLGSYEIVEHLASGGMAEIYLAEQRGPLGFRKRVVVKRIKSDHSGDPNFESMFLDEARISAQLSHPNIVQTYELDHSGEEWFVAMEYVDGPSFETVLERAAIAGEPVDPGVTIRVVLDVLSALDYSHDFVDHEGRHLAIVHRDVTPSNILISTAGVAKLADFGIAKAVGRETETQTGAVKGKYGYMAPEQIDGSGVDARTDLFAVGVVLYEALCGEKPFGEGLKAVHGVIASDPIPLGEQNPDIPAEVCAVVDRALRKPREDRFTTAAEMLAELEESARSHGILGTTTDVVRRLDLQPTRAPEPDPHASTVASDGTALVAEGAAPVPPNDHRWLPVIAVVAAIAFFAVAAAVAAISTGDDTPAITAPDAGATNAGSSQRDTRLDPAERKKLEERDRKAEERREKLEKRREKLEKRLEKRNKSGKGKAKGPK